LKNKPNQVPDAEGSWWDEGRKKDDFWLCLFGAASGGETTKEYDATEMMLKSGEERKEDQ